MTSAINRSSRRLDHLAAFVAAILARDPAQVPVLTIAVATGFPSIGASEG
jgi:hypothetical protein